MKKYIVAAGLFLLMNSCLNNDFMEVYPKDQQTELTSFRSYENFKTYSWGLYNVFFGYAYKTGQTDEIFKGDYEADNMIKHVSGNESQWAYQKAKVPASSDSWDYEYIRRVNLMLDNIDQSSMNDAEKAHWRSVGYFFRAYKYFKMLLLFGISSSFFSSISILVFLNFAALSDGMLTRSMFAKNPLVTSTPSSVHM